MYKFFITYASVKLPMPIVTIMINYKYLHMYVCIDFRLEFHAGRQAMLCRTSIYKIVIISQLNLLPTESHKPKCNPSLSLLKIH